MLQLKAHTKWVHYPRQEVRCDQCGKKVEKRRLKNHSDIIHNKTKNFSCTLCEKAFPTDRSLKGHTSRIHEGNKEVQCELCNKTFISITTLKSHINKIHDKIFFKCDLCSKSFGVVLNR